MSAIESDIIFERIPEHVAIIMDGNGRWAQERGLPRLAGHRAGTENLRRVIEASVEYGIKYLTLFAFSTENWGRPEKEVTGLMSIFDTVFERELPELSRQGVQLRHVGSLEGVKQSLRDKILNAIEKTKNNNRLILNIAFNYGGRQEILNAFRQIVEEGLPAEEITCDVIARHMYTAGIPDPDMVVRTSGEQRASNFLLWQGAYSEWYYPEVFWPDFGKQELKKAIQEYNRRERRFGLVADSSDEE